ncbi:protein of unknown function [Candidatus Hydrogenisulfobacillus filiaventi]|uniref:Uncharacterized protein n=1 Tax=Candidatus Hydrogenisulfobacillus filiaventi TaxID=2707344 RepID=A0A6F8ZIS3_9FIRM|nr:protein of unknown function [Candidatus Hydrogenisulfobacillus filiaventi]
MSCGPRRLLQALLHDCDDSRLPGAALAQRWLTALDREPGFEVLTLRQWRTLRAALDDLAAAPADAARRATVRAFAEAMLPAVPAGTAEEAVAAYRRLLRLVDVE